MMETNDFSLKTFTPKLEALQFMVSPLHAWIRFPEFVLSISYRMDIQKWHVKQNGAGNSNVGITARRAFANSKHLSSITCFDETLLINFHFILITISCEQTFCLHMKTYPLYQMSPTIHKVLIHCFQINNSTLVPIGCLVENDLGARNKI